MVGKRSRRRAAAVAEGQWTAATLPALAANEGGWVNYTLRQVIPAANIPKDGTAVRLGFRAGTTEGLQIDKVYVGVRGAGSWDFNGAQVQALFGGLPGVTLAAEATQISDTTNLSITTTDDIIVSIYVGTSVDTFRNVYSPGGGIGAAYEPGDSAADTLAGSQEGGTDALYLEDFEVFGP